MAHGQRGARRLWYKSPGHAWWPVPTYRSGSATTLTPHTSTPDRKDSSAGPITKYKQMAKRLALRRLSGVGPTADGGTVPVSVYTSLWGGRPTQSAHAAVRISVTRSFSMTMSCAARRLANRAVAGQISVTRAAYLDILQKLHRKQRGRQEDAGDDRLRHVTSRAIHSHPTSQRQDPCRAQLINVWGGGWVIARYSERTVPKKTAHARRPRARRQCSRVGGASTRVIYALPIPSRSR